MAFAEDEISVAELLNRPLWHLQFADGTLCVAEDEEELYLVLFTSSDRAAAFAAEGDVADGATATPALFSQSEEEFEQGVEQVAGDGLHGAIIDPDSEEDQVLIRFDEDEEYEDEEV